MGVKVAPWQERRVAFPPRRGIVDLWRCPLQPGVSHPPEDLERAARFRSSSADAAAAFLARRSAARRVLGGVLDCDPLAVVFGFDAGGRPTLVGGASDWLQFSPSSSGDIAVIAVARDRSVGVDVEAVQPPDPVVVDRMFTAAERDHVNAETFAVCWAMKEALVKALGTGLSLDLRLVEVVCDGPVETEVWATALGATEPIRWTVCPIPAGDHYAAAVAVAGKVGEIRCYDLAAEP